jgi:hypothetical protein
MTPTLSNSPKFASNIRETACSVDPKIGSLRKGNNLSWLGNVKTGSQVKIHTKISLMALPTIAEHEFLHRLAVQELEDKILGRKGAHTKLLIGPGILNETKKCLLQSA